jgi:prepilin-type N-terminal cleavage/methylation domain-containing protein
VINYFIKFKKNKGFTLIELLVVIAIIGILSSVVLASLNIARMKARDSRRIQDLKQIKLALELYYDTNGYYPQSVCGWDCNGYRYSSNSISWNILAVDLAPYISTLPKDPINSNCYPWVTGCYSYTYGNVGRTTYKAQYDLTAQLEDTKSPYRCSVKFWRAYFDNSDAWCGSYSGQIYEASN